MRFVVTVLLTLCLSAVFAKGHESNAGDPDRDSLNEPGGDNLPVLPEVDDFDSQKYFEEKWSDSYSSWDNTDFRLYNPHFDDNQQNAGDDLNKFKN